ncbi:MAG TPA: GIY-YIG nuclease family protein [Allosphingosinicella sp.]|nr:GIY-YIG nuclease family protein [Allosphingosinicella sp.]
MQFWVYILRCRDGSYYVGHTDDLQKRLWEHEQGLAADWTRRRRPVELVWCDWADTRDEVFAFERRVKNWSRAKKEALIAGDWERIGYLARPPHERPSTSAKRPKFILRGAAGGSEGLRTSEVGDLHAAQPNSDSLVPSKVEGRDVDAGAKS